MTASKLLHRHACGRRIGCCLRCVLNHDAARDRGIPGAVLRKGGQASGVDEDRASGVPQGELHLWRRQPGVQRNEDRPQGADGKEGLEKGRMVLPQVGDTGTALDAPLAQRLRQPIDAVAEVGIARFDTVEDQRRLVPGFHPPPVDPRAQSLIQHRRHTLSRSPDIQEPLDHTVR